jgi:hypothetical protein
METGGYRRRIGLIACLAGAALMAGAPATGVHAQSGSTPAPSPSPTAPQPQNDVPGTGQKMFNKGVADKLDGYLKRMNAAIKACDKLRYDSALKDFEYFVDYGFEKNFDPFFKAFDDINHPAQWRDDRLGGLHHQYARM